jgi:hypothetical protein
LYLIDADSLSNLLKQSLAEALSFVYLRVSDEQEVQPFIKPKWLYEKTFLPGIALPYWSLHR